MRMENLLNMKNSILKSFYSTKAISLASSFVFSLVATASGELNLCQMELAEPKSVAAVMARVAATNQAGQVTYAAGYGWEKAGEITTPNL